MALQHATTSLKRYNLLVYDILQDPRGVKTHRYSLVIEMDHLLSKLFKLKKGTRLKSQHRIDPLSSVFLLEKLPNEMIYEIYQYLSSFDILYAFSQLNMRFDSLMHRFIQYFDLSNLSFKQIELYSKKIFPLYGCYVDSLVLSDSYIGNQITLLYQKLKVNETFFNIKKLKLIKCTNEEFLLFIAHFNKFECLQDLDIVTCEYLLESINNLMFKNIFQNRKRRTLKNVSIIQDGISCACKFLNLKSDPIYLRCYHIRNLTLQLNYIDQIFLLCRFLPNIEQLTVHVCSLCDLKKNTLDFTTKLNIPYLKEFSIIFHSFITFNMLKIFLKTFCSTIKQLSIRIIHNRKDSDLIDGYKWEMLLSDEFLSNLHEFHLCTTVDVSSSDKSINLIKILEKFSTEFWLKKKKWYVNIDCLNGTYNNSIYLYTMPYYNDDFCLASDFTKPLSTIPLELNSSAYINIQKLDLRWLSGNSLSMKSFILIFEPFSNVKELYIDVPENRFINSDNEIETKIILPKLKHLSIISTNGITNAHLLVSFLSIITQFSSLELSYFDLTCLIRNNIIMKQIEQLQVFSVDVVLLNNGQFLKYLSIIFPNLKHLKLRPNRAIAFVKQTLITEMVKCFKNLISMDIEHRQNSFYFNF
ncbi:unnamed protein product [Didymodactylos carnosus]|uniref:F-box domain-containing protein n=1 Tax=Didymodactylos carnosus TaxID=1234261 RepID=A0A814PD03_9BILA|nr:unnamed protein product [Didymodactylos carnosus]CAF3869183.1 unnamed protein product [Didymodactylos carnosus]